ncbi:MAG TPA: pilus assembly protein [bacterium]|nr:pilus assembly protein [bacterium]
MSTDRRPSRRRSCSGQAMVELAFMILILVALVLGIFEITVLYYNTSVITNAMHQASWAAVNGADDIIIRETLFAKMQELLVTVYVSHRVSEPTIRVYNRFERDHAILSPFLNDAAYYSPRREQVAGYAFRSEGYQLELAVDYEVGFSIPFIGYIHAISIPLVEEACILARNDLDHDGLTDVMEQEYYVGIYNHSFSLSAPKAWVPYSHLDNNRCDMMYDDDDGDGIADATDSVTTAGVWQMFSRYDSNNDGTEDKYDVEWRKNPARLHVN